MSGRTTRDARAAEPSWLATLGGAVLLIVVGFGIGLVAGVAYEEPDLVVEQLAGRSTKVALDDLGGAPPTADEAQLEPPTVPLQEAPPVETPPVAAPPPAPASPAAPPPPRPAPPPASGGFAVQVGAFAEAAGAESLVAKLQGLGFAAYLAEAGGGVPAPYRVRVGPMVSREAADRMAARLKQEHRLPTWVLAEDRS